MPMFIVALVKKSKQAAFVNRDNPNCNQLTQKDLPNMNANKTRVITPEDVIPLNDDSDRFLIIIDVGR